MDSTGHRASFRRARAYAYPRGNAGLSTELAFVRFDPMMVPKRSLTRDSTERMDPRVLRGPANRALPAISSPAAAVSSHSVPPSTLHWPILNTDRMHDNIEVEDLRQEQAPLAYRQTVLLGLEAVENALVTHREARRRFDRLREAEGVERRAVALAHDRYRSRLVDFLDGLETERTLYAAQTEPGARRARRLPGSRPIVQGARRWLATTPPGRR